MDRRRQRGAVTGDYEHLRKRILGLAPNRGEKSLNVCPLFFSRLICVCVFFFFALILQQLPYHFLHLNKVLKLVVKMRWHFSSPPSACKGGQQLAGHYVGQLD